MTRAVIYARFSSAQQDPKSIDDQIRDCRAYADRNGWTVIQVYSDSALSATTMHRPALQTLMADAAARGFDIVITEALNRLSRNQADTEKIRELLAYVDVRIFTLHQGHATEMHTAFEGLKNAQFVKDLAITLRRAQRGTAAKGLAAGGISYGYDVVREFDAKGNVPSGRRRIKDAEAEVVRRIFAEYVAGVSAYEIVRRLNSERIPAPGARSNRSNGQWCITTIVGNKARANGILHNRLYVGELVYNRTRKVKNPNTGKRLIRINPQSEWQITQVPELRVIDDAVWAAAQELKGRHRQSALHLRRRPKHLLSGLMACGCCRGPYVVRDSSRIGCATHRQKQTCDNARTINHKAVQDRILVKLRTLMSGPKAIAVFVKEYHEHLRALQAGSAKTNRAATKELGDVKAKIARLVVAIEDGGDAKAIAGRVRELEARQAVLEREIAAVAAAPVELQPNAHEVFARKIVDLEAGLTKDPAERAQSITDLRGLIDLVVLTPDDSEPGGLAIEVEGKLDGLVRLATGSGQNRPETHVDISGARGRDHSMATLSRVRFRA